MGEFFTQEFAETVKKSGMCAREEQDLRELTKSESFFTSPICGRKRSNCFLL